MYFYRKTYSYSNLVDGNYFVTTLVTSSNIKKYLSSAQNPEWRYKSNTVQWKRQPNTIQHLRKFSSLNLVINNRAHINLAQLCTTKYITELRPFPLKIRILILEFEFKSRGYSLRKQIKTCYYLPLTAFNLFPTICFATKDAIVGDYLQQKLYFITIKKITLENFIWFITIWKDMNLTNYSVKILFI